ncbi:MAG: selenoneine biosynthesis selenosugar synthase SenB [Sedimenticolaceae bacterium]
MHIVLITPAPVRSLSGNRATANRWARLLRALGHRVDVAVEYNGQRADLMVALHAWRSAAAIQAFSSAYPERPLIVVLTGTDAYHFIHTDSETTLASLAAADRIVGLHGLIADCVPDTQRHKVRVIYQSARPLGGRRPPRRFFRVCVAGHLRDEKDSLRTALAVRDLPPSSRIRVDAYGKAHTAEWERAARAEAAGNARYRWHGEIAHSRLRDVYRRSHVLALTSRMEGGANVVSEAVMADLPVIASRIPGSVGLLGANYPGYYPAEDTRALRDLLLRAESDPTFYTDLQAACRKRRPLFSEQAEQAGWAELLADIV